MGGRRILRAPESGLRQASPDTRYRSDNPALARSGNLQPQHRPAAGYPVLSDLHYNFKQSALFGEATYRFTDQWALTGGIRGFKFTEDKSVYFGGLFSNHPATPVPVLGSTDSSGVAPRLILTYDPTRDVKLNL